MNTNLKNQIFMTIENIKDKILNIQQQIYNGGLSEEKKAVWHWWLRYYQNKLNLLEKSDQKIEEPEVTEIKEEPYVNLAGEPLPF